VGKDVEGNVYVSFIFLGVYKDPIATVIYMRDIRTVMNCHFARRCDGEVTSCFNASARSDRRKQQNVPPTIYGALAQFLSREVQVVKTKHKEQTATFCAIALAHPCPTLLRASDKSKIIIAFDKA
jgi:hypothetical protein